ncbi:hypothetical protein [Ralstonia solanacearum]|uniref:hypothetical protein n=1 Tax=Ralstonia solanacearum TaxID=305 RepID=UPI0002DBCCFD|nr:hypothetical protein [Ralstonia solanacearum]MDC6175965.1 hypothetical protein [Ralstonia solanacearum]MDC6239499.1 hypothetical protein [Ralstonia solanacearum]MDD7799380.1 hypothetical protein [Ralstonia solanacearum]
MVKGRFSFGSGVAGQGGEHGNRITGDLTHAGGKLSSNGVALDNHGHGNVQRGSDWMESMR